MASRISIAQVEVRGQAIQAIVAAMSLTQKRALKILASHGISPLENERWYPMAQLVEATKTIQAEIGPNTMKAVGRKIPETAPFPPDIQTIEEAFRSINLSYRMSHRGPGNIGGYLYEPAGERKGRMHCDTPYPCTFDQGLLESVGERFRPKDSIWVRVEHQPGSCRSEGASSCTFNISW